jgi:hypothetical protein
VKDVFQSPDLGISPTEGAQNLLQHLKPNKATGLDDIPAKFLKEVSIEISPLISIIKPPDKNPPIMMKSKMFFFYTFFYIDGDIRFFKA